MSTADWIAVGIIVLCVIFAVIYMIRQRKKGGCNGGCGNCPYSGSCPSNERKTENDSEQA